MAKLTKEEFIEKYSEKIDDKDLSIELMEDISDSLEVSSSEETDSLKEENETLKKKVKTLESEKDDLKERYRQRFLSKEEDEKSEKSENEETKEYDEKEVIDVKEI